MLRVNYRWTYLDFAPAFSQFLYWIYMCYLYFFKQLLNKCSIFLWCLLLYWDSKKEQLDIGTKSFRWSVGPTLSCECDRCQFLGSPPPPQTCWLKRAGKSLRIYSSNKLSRWFFYNQSRDTLKNTLIRLTPSREDISSTGYKMLSVLNMDKCGKTKCHLGLPPHNRKHF